MADHAQTARQSGEVVIRLEGVIQILDQIGRARRDQRPAQDRRSHDKQDVRPHRDRWQPWRLQEPDLIETALAESAEQLGVVGLQRRTLLLLRDDFSVDTLDLDCALKRRKLLAQLSDLGIRGDDIDLKLLELVLDELAPLLGVLRGGCGRLIDDLVGESKGDRLGQLGAGIGHADLEQVVGCRDRVLGQDLDPAEGGTNPVLDHRALGQALVILSERTADSELDGARVRVRAGRAHDKHCAGFKDLGQPCRDVVRSHARDHT